MAWLQLLLDLEDLAPGQVEDCCHELGALSVTLSDAGDHPVLEPMPGATPLWPAIRLSALFAGDVDGEQLRQRLASLLDIPAQRIAIEILEDRNWSEEWRKGFEPICFGSRLWICPGGERPADPDALIIDLDPGLAFGTGTHPSTAMCLHWLCRVPIQDMRVIDYGCGSGILALAAARLGAKEVLATDIDPQALLATGENARNNGLDKIIRVCTPDALPDTETDILVANILANPLRELAPRFAQLLKAGGSMAMAGILQEQSDSVLATYRSAFEVLQLGRNGDWALLGGRRKP